MFGKISKYNENVVSQAKHKSVFTETHSGVLATNGYYRNRLVHDISDENVLRDTAVGSERHN